VAWQGQRDPLLDSPRFRRNRTYLKGLRLPCSLCGRCIDYSQPGAFVAGHIVSRYRAKQLGWTEEQINSLNNLRTECRSCSMRTGAREGGRVKHANIKRRRGTHLTDAHRW
jgi:hypothetical protein